MQYWIIMGVLTVIAVVLLAVIIATLVKGKKSRDDYEDDYDNGYAEDEYDDDEDDYEPPRRRQQQRRTAEDTEQIPARVRNAAPQSNGPVKRQWKIILENLDTWEKYTFIFYDNIGVGRGKTNQEFEKYLSVPDDPRVSKLHCAIIRKGDKLYLKDMGSRNGTYLNGKQITQPIVVQRDDVIGIGETKIEVVKVLRERGTD